MKTTQIDKYKLGSSPLVSSPGIWRWAKHHYDPSFSPEDSAYVLRVVSSTWHLDADIAQLALAGAPAIRIEIDDKAETVTIIHTYTKEEA